MTEKTHVRDRLSFLVLVGLLWGSMTYAQSERLSQAFSETLLELNNNSSNLGQQIFCRENPEEFNFGPDQMEIVDQCMQSLCGDPQNNPTTTLTEHNLTRFVDPASHDQMAPLRQSMEEALISEKDRNQRFIERTRQLVRQGSLRIDPSSMYPQNWVDIVKRVYGPYVRSYADDSAPLGERFKVNVRSSIQSKAQGLHQDFLTAFANQYERFVNEGPWYVKIQHGVTTLSEARELLRQNYQRDKARMQQALDNDNIFQKVWGGYDRERYTILENAMESLDRLGEKELKMVTDLYIETYSSITDEPAVGREFCAEGRCRDGINQYLSNLNVDEVLEDLESQNTNRSIAEVMRQCRYQVLADNILRPDPARIRAAYPEVIAKFNQNVLSGYSEHSRREFNTIARNELELDTLDYDRNNVQSALTASFNAVRMRNEIELEANKELDRNDILVWLFRKNTRAQISYAEGVTWKVAPFQDVNPCRGRKPHVGGDYFSLEERGKPYKINLSAHTCTHIHAGKATLAHELGHFLSRLFLEGRLSQESYQEYGHLRQCAALGYKTMETLPPRFLELNGGHPGDTVKTEEDMADLIGVMAMGIPGPGEEARAPGSCVLLTPNANQTSYSHRNLVSHPDSKHSSAPIRVLIEAIHQKRQMSSACQQVLRSNINYFRFGSCF